MNKIFNISGTLLLTAILLLTAACSSDSSNDVQPSPTPDNSQEITLNPTVWQMMEGRRATTYDAGTLTSGSFTAAAYVANSTTAYINPIQVNWNTSQWEWSDGKHYWPASGNLDFFAYMPATIPSYIKNSSSVASSLDYYATSSPSVTHTVSFSADLSSGADTEFVFALTTGQNKTTPGASGVTLNFLHPFARVKFATGSVPSTVTINSVTLDGVMTKGDYSYNGSTSTWSSQSTSGSIDGRDNWIIVVPYNNSTQTLTVNCTWSEWSNVTKNLTASITANWAASTSYTYTLNISKDYALTVDTSKYTEQW